jgi:hypothetical protein
LHMSCGFDMDADIFCAGFDRPVDIAFWFLHHQMAVHGDVRKFPYRLHGGEVEAKVTYETSVHDVDVKEIDAGFAQLPEIVLKIHPVRASYRSFEFDRPAHGYRLKT